jgi:hypothetical protein
MERDEKRKFVFVVGAGASCDFGFPLGATLATEIEKRLDLEFNENGGVGPHPTPILAALGSSRDSDEYRKAARQLRGGIGINESIDQFLMKRRRNPHVRDLGLMTLAHVILDGERNSNFMGYNRTDWERSLSARRSTNMSWPAILMEHFIGDLSPEDICAETFSDAAFVIFNYDRCVQQSFLYRLQIKHDLSFEAALEIVHSIPMVHVYGTLGEIDGSVPFGAQDAPLADISRTLRTYHDGVVDEAHASRICSMINGAERIIFLGFGFHPENVKLLFNKGMPKAQMCGTSKGCLPIGPFKEISEQPGSAFSDCNPTDFLMNHGFRLMTQPLV